jgi:predicted dehydrogenase
MSGKLFHAPFIHAHPGFALAAITERHQAASQQIYPHIQLYRSVTAMLEDASLDLIIVNTPNQYHYEQARQALLAGKHVVVEKPFTITVQQAEDLQALAATTNRVLAVYQNRRYDGDFAAVRQCITEKWLGDIREAEIRYDRFRPQPGGKQHKEGAMPGAGVLYDLSPHLADQAIHLFGFPDAVWADAFTMREGVAAHDYFELLLFYPQLRVRLKASCVARESHYAYILHGTKGSFLQQRSDTQEQHLLAGVAPSLEPWCTPPAAPDGLLHTTINGVETRKATTAVPGNYMHYYNDLYKALCGAGPNPAPARDGINTIRIIEAALQSIATGRRVSF